MKKFPNEKLQSRRAFFKTASESALPIMAAILLANTPVNLNAASINEKGCNCSSCTGTCKGGCRTSCEGPCASTCSGGCKNSHCKSVAK